MRLTTWVAWCCFVSICIESLLSHLDRANSPNAVGVVVQNDDNSGMYCCRVKLTRPGASEPFAVGLTDQNGFIEFRNVPHKFIIEAGFGKYKARDFWTVKRGETILLNTLKLKERPEDYE